MADEDSETKFCTNCKKDISANNFTMHEAHCRRHITLCKHCAEPIPKAEIDQHYQDEHAPITCEKCGQNVEKMHLEKHEEADCPQRPQHCLYCELEFPKSELGSHLEYCGSRTEQCLKCFQFIMLKDQLRHDESDCRPQLPRSSAANSVPFSYSSSLINPHDHDAVYRPIHNPIASGADLNPFVFDEMSRLLNNHGDRPEIHGHMTSDIFSNNSLANSGSSNLRRRNEFTQPKRSNVDRQRNSITHNVNQPEVSVSPSQTEDDYDYLLALHLATDLETTEDLGPQTFNSVNNYSESELFPLSDQRAGILSVRNTDPASDVERDFWRSAFSTASQSETGYDIGPSEDSYLTLNQPISTQISDINSSREISTNQIPPDIPILDNLSYAAAQNWLSADEAIDREGTMLPCEFCGVLLPMEFIVQHQGVCDAQPDIESPVVQSPQVMPKRKTSNVLRNKDKVTNLSTAATSSMSRSRLQDDSISSSTARSRPQNLTSKRNFTNNSDESSIGSNGVANIKALLSKSKQQPTSNGRSQVSNLSRHQPPPQSSNQRLRQRGQRSFETNHSNESLEEVGLEGAASIPRRSSSTKAVKQSDNRAKQTGGGQVGRGLPRPPAGNRHPSSGSSNDSSHRTDSLGEAMSIRSIENPSNGAAPLSRPPVNNSSSRQPRRSGNQMFAGTTRRTPKRHLPERPS